MRTKFCITCKRKRLVKFFYPHKRMSSGLQSACKQCMREWHRARPDYVRRKNADFRRKNPDYARDYQRKARYGITPEQVQHMRRKQGGKCRGCEKPLVTVKECVDHCHKTGRVRGLLCNACNLTLSFASESPQVLRKLANYLSKKG